jgi:SPP1 gp7 family putative phage head morphogenesis protein
MEEVATYKQVKNYDPTRTTLLRNAFARDMNKRFTEFTIMVKRSVYNNDCFGLNKVDLGVHQMQPLSKEELKYKTSSEKIALFLLWAQTQIDRGVLNILMFQDPWTNKYVYEAYRRGVIRARQELIKAGMKIPTIEEMGGIEVVLKNIYHVERLGLLQGKVFTDLKGITDAMSTQISRILTQGFLNGEAPALLARKLVATINGTNMGDLGITDTLGRFIPAARRAEMLARTEIIRAYAESTLQEFRNWGVEGVSAKAEFQTAGDDRVCPKCEHLQGKVYTLDEANGVIPVHPKCRCIWLPWIVDLQKYM